MNETYATVLEMQLTYSVCTTQKLVLPYPYQQKVYN